MLIAAHRKLAAYYVNMFTNIAVKQSSDKTKARRVPTRNQRIDMDDGSLELANRLFFKLYQCANMLHKTGSRALEAERLTTQQWAVLGALSGERAADGLSVGDLADYLMVTRQNLSGVISRMERDGHVNVSQDVRDRRSRIVTMTKSGRRVWQKDALPKIHRYYETALGDFSSNDLAHTLHYLVKILENMQKIDKASSNASGNNLD